MSFDPAAPCFVPSLNQEKPKSPREDVQVQHGDSSEVEKLERERVRHPVREYASLSSPGRGKLGRRLRSSGQNKEQGKSSAPRSIAHQRARRGRGAKRDVVDPESASLSAEERINLEIAKMESGGRRRPIDASFLLNFQFDHVVLSPQDVEDEPAVHHAAPRASSFRKEKFVHGNFRFVCKGGDLLPAVEAIPRERRLFSAMFDPDFTLEWNDVFMVVCMVPTACPICLHHPVIPRVSPCGHVFCFGCVARYFEHVKPVAKTYGGVGHAPRIFGPCPICHSVFCLGEMKRCLMNRSVPRRVGQRIVLSLGKCERGSAVPFPGNLWRVATTFPQYGTELGAFSRIVVIDREDLSSLLTSELADFSEAKVIAQEGQEEGLVPLLDGGMAETDAELERCSSLGDCVSPSSGTEGPEEALIMTSASKTETTPLSSPSADGCRFFYQLGDGSSLFLHPRCMKEILGGRPWDECLPQEISGTISSSEHFVISVGFRKRFRVFDHLPIGSPISLCVLEDVALCREDVVVDLIDPMEEHRETIETIKSHAVKDTTVPMPVVVLDPTPQEMVQKVDEARRQERTHRPTHPVNEHRHSEPSKPTSFLEAVQAHPQESWEIQGAIGVRRSKDQNQDPCQRSQRRSQSNVVFRSGRV